MSVFYAAILLALVNFITSHLQSEATPVPNTTHHQTLSTTCKVGEIAENDCNKCICTSDHSFNCVSKPCNQTAGQNPKDKVACQPSMVYIKNVTACLCKEDGSWPHHACKTMFHSFQVKAKDSCEPNTFLIVDCNVCKCGPNGKINKKQCTKNKCKADLKNSRRYIKQNQVYGSCEPKNWYSLASCQFCYCISENKLVCNKGNHFPKKLKLGIYNLTICGKDLIKDAINLIPNTDQTLRFGNNETTNDPDNIDTTTESLTPVKLNGEYNEKIVEVEQQRIEQQQMKPQKMEQQLIEQQLLQHHQLEQQNTNDSDEYETDSDESKPQIPIAREGSSTKLPYDEDDDHYSDSENENQAEPYEMEKPESSPANSIAINKAASQPSPTPEVFSQHFEYPDLANSAQTNEAFKLGDVLKPYLPVVLDKVFQMALRKSMLSIDAHSNCTPGATTVYKCNACFCLKNKKLLCTNNECK